MKTVLIVEDEKLIRQGLAAMLKRAPVPIETVLQAHNGAEALTILQSQPVDAMITDVRMPEMDGMELAARAAVLPQPPLVLVISGYDDFNYAVNMMRSGVQDYLLKPVEREALYQALAKIDAQLAAASSEASAAHQLKLQALRCLMTDASLGHTEAETMIRQYSDSFLQGEYRVFCLRRPPESTLDLLCVPAETGLVAACVPESNAFAPCETAGCSTPHTGLAAVRESYREALEAFKCAFFGETDSVETYSAHLWSQADYDKQSLVQMLQYMAASRWQDAARILRRTFHSVREGMLHPDGAALLVRDFLSQLAETYKTMLPIDDELHALTDLWQYADANTFCDVLDQWLEGFAGRLARECDDYQNKQKIRDAVQYVQQHYTEPLNMTIVSNQVSMNYSLFSLLFKQYVGTNFVVYLQKLRVDAACRLLRETEMHANEIGRRVGFTDDKNFLKVFKGHCGLSPTEYRRAEAARGAAALPSSLS